MRFHSVALLTACAAGLMLAAGAAAQQQQPAAPQQEREQQRQVQDEQRAVGQEVRRHFRTDEITGMDVLNKEGENLGSIDDLVIDIQEGSAKYAALSFGGFLGLGDDLHAVPMEKLQLYYHREDDDYFFVLDVPRETLEQAEGFDRDKWPAVHEAEWMIGIDRHYGVERERERDGRAADPRDDPAIERRDDPATEPRDDPATEPRDDPATDRRDDPATEPREDRDDRNGVFENGLFQDDDPRADEQQAREGDVPGMHVFRASELTNMNVRNREGEDLGRVRDIMLDATTGKMAYYGLGFDGILGFGEDLYAVPREAMELQYNAEDEEHFFVLNIPRETLEQTEGFDNDEWPAQADPRLTEGVERPRAADRPEAPRRN